MPEYDLAAYLKDVGNSLENGVLRIASALDKNRLDLTNEKPDTIDSINKIIVSLPSLKIQLSGKNRVKSIEFTVPGVRTYLNNINPDCILAFNKRGTIQAIKTSDGKTKGDINITEEI